MAVDGCTSDVCWPDTGYLDCEKQLIKKTPEKTSFAKSIMPRGLINGGMSIRVKN